MYYQKGDEKLKVLCSELNVTNDKPMMNRVLIKVRKVEEKTKGGILLSESAIEKEQFNKTVGVIIDIGESAFEEWDVKPEIGDIVAFARYGGIPYAPIDKEYLAGEEGAEFRLVADKEILTIQVKKGDNNE
jgi:chaperonin GroES